MNEKFYIVLLIFFAGFVAWALGRGCRTQEQYNVSVQTINTAADGLDLEKLGPLIKKASSAEKLEQLLNDKSEGVNNLDLDEDGKVDFIKVTEYGDANAQGFSLTAEPAAGEEQEIATIEVEKVNDREANVEVNGSREIYGHNHYRHSSFGIGDYLLLSYLFRPHTPYMSPWHYGRYPNYYGRYSTVPQQEYARRTASSGGAFRSSSTSAMKSDITSPNQGKTANSIKAPLRNPTSSQKSFQARNPSQKTVRKGGFGKKTTKRSTTPSRPSVRKSSTFRSGGRSGGK